MHAHRQNARQRRRGSRASRRALIFVTRRHVEIAAKIFFLAEGDSPEFTIPCEFHPRSEYSGIFPQTGLMKTNPCSVSRDAQTTNIPTWHAVGALINMSAITIADAEAASAVSAALAAPDALGVPASLPLAVPAPHFQGDAGTASASGSDALPLVTSACGIDDAACGKHEASKLYAPRCMLYYIQQI